MTAAKGGYACAIGAVIFVASPAGAVEREHHFGVDGGGLVENNGSPDVGLSVGAHWAYGINDAFNLIAEASWSFVALGKGANAAGSPRRPSSIGAVDVGVGYVLDVIRWVPYAGVMAGGYGLSGGTVHGETLLPGAVIALGLDYRVLRTLSVGVAAREHMFVTALSSYPSYTQVMARVEYTWGW